jgi:hypothetical protein
MEGGGERVWASLFACRGRVKKDAQGAMRQGLKDMTVVEPLASRDMQDGRLVTAACVWWWCASIAPRIPRESLPSACCACKSEQGTLSRQSEKWLFFTVGRWRADTFFNPFF